MDLSKKIAYNKLPDQQKTKLLTKQVRFVLKRICATLTTISNDDSDNTWMPFIAPDSNLHDPNCNIIIMAPDIAGQTGNVTTNANGHYYVSGPSLIKELQKYQQEGHSFSSPETAMKFLQFVSKQEPLFVPEDE